MSKIKQLVQQANRINEDTIATFDGGSYNIDTDEQGHYIRNTDGNTFRIEDDNIVFSVNNGNEDGWSIPIKEAKAFAESILYLLKAVKKTEDGTVADLGLVPTGHTLKKPGITEIGDK